MLHVIAPTLPWQRARVELAGRRLRLERGEPRDGLAEVVVRVEATGSAGAAAPGEPAAGAEAIGPPVEAVLDGLAAEAVLDWLAAAGCPAVGDVARGGRPDAGGVRLRRVGPGSPGPADLWPTCSPFAPDARRGPGEGVLRISTAAARAVRRGHPWVLADPATESPRRFAPGAVIRLAAPGPKGRGRGRGGAAPAGGARSLGLWLADDGEPVVARRWSREARTPRDAASVEARVARAVGRRREIAAEGGGSLADADAVRLVHGEADGLPGLFLDRLGPVLRVLVTTRATLGLAVRAADAVLGGLAAGAASGGPGAVVEVVHLRRPPPGELECVRLVRGSLGDATGRSDTRVIVREGPLRLWVEPGLDAPTRSRPGVGLFLDQRETRAWLAARTRPGGRYANLFAHTGAFGLRLLAAGAGVVESVDLSGPYLDWLEENLALSGLPAARHRSVRRDVRRWLQETPAEPAWDGIVLDPPTAAAAGRRYFSARRALEPLAAACLSRLAPGGWLLVSRHARGGRGGLAALVERAAREAGVAVGLERPPPAPDFPHLPGFPEGDPFEAALATRRDP